MTEAQQAVFRAIEVNIRRMKVQDHPFVLGITGIDCSGKSHFAAGLDRFLQGRGSPVQLVKLDDFHQPAAVRYADGNRDEDHYARVREGREFDFDRIVTEVLRPARSGRPFTTHIAAVDWRSDAVGIRPLTITPDTVVIVEGVFLFLEPVRPYLDYVIFIDVSEDECLRRAAVRDPADTVPKYRTRYLPAARACLAEYPPETHAELLVNNMDWGAPLLEERRLSL